MEPVRHGRDDPQRDCPGWLPDTAAMEPVRHGRDDLATLRTFYALIGPQWSPSVTDGMTPEAGGTVDQSRCRNRARPSRTGSPPPPPVRPPRPLPPHRARPS